MHVDGMKVMWDDWTARAPKVARDEVNGHLSFHLLDKFLGRYSKQRYPS
jgi:hypothetical protein